MVAWHNQSHEFMHCVLNDGRKIAMPRYYKQKIYDEYTRIMFGQLGFQRMQEEKNKLLSRYQLSPQEYEEELRKAKNAAYKKQQFKTAARQKIF